MKKRLTGIVLIITVLATSLLAGCGGKKAKTTESGLYTWFPFGTVLQPDYAKEKETWVDSESKLNVNKVIESVEMTDELIYGRYIFYSESGRTSTNFVEEDFYNDCEWKSYLELFGEVPEKDYDNNYLYSTVPFAFVAGPNNCYDAACYIPGYNWCELRFAKKSVSNPKYQEYNYYRVPATYEISGNKIKFHLLTNYDYDRKENTMDYEFGEAYVEYTFDRQPYTISFSDGNKTVNMMSKSLVNTSSSYVDAYFRGENFVLDGMDIKKLVFSASRESNKVNCYVEVNSDDRALKAATVACKLEDNGLFTLCFKPKDGQTKVYEYVLYNSEYDGFTLINENEVIRCSREDYNSSQYAGMKIKNLREEDIEKYEQLSEETIEKIETTRKNLLEDLTTEFADAEIGVNVDKDTGEIVLDSAILFATDKSDVSADGQEVLKKFISSFYTVMQKEDYKDFIDEIKITGHTDSTGEYEHNVELSKARAESVKGYCLEAMSDDTTAKAKFEALLTSEGKASDELVLDADGNEDKAASRRVVFTFYINLDAIN